MKFIILFLLSLFLSTVSIFGKSDTFYTTGQNAKLMLSGIDFNNTGGALLFNHPTGIATDGVHLLLADRWNNRILVWNSIPASNIAPDLVLGQTNFITNNPGVELSELNWPGSIAITSDGRVVVADSYNDRLLIWSTFPTQNGEAADIEISYDTLNSHNYRWPWGVWTDGTKLVATSTGSGKVLIWLSFPVSNHQPPDFILTGKDSSDTSRMGTPRTITSNGSYLIIGDHNPRVGGTGQGNFVWKTFPSSDQPYDFFMRDPEDPNFAWLQGEITPNNKLIMLGRFLYIWNTLPQNATTPPSLTVNGYEFNGGDGSDLCVVGSKIFISPMNSNKIVVYNSIPVSPTQLPDFAIGSPDIYTNTLETHYFITNPMPISNGQNLFVSSDFHRKLYVWRNLPTFSGVYPDTTISLNEPPWDNALLGDTLILAGRKTVYIWTTLPLYGEVPTYTYRDSICNAVFEDIGGVALDSKYFYLADKPNKLYVWEGVPKGNPPPSPKFTLLIPQPGRLNSDGNYLTLTSCELHRISIYEVATLDSNALPCIELSNDSGQWFNLPMDAIVVDSHLFIANTCFNNVYVWEHLSDAGDFNKVIVLGDSNIYDRKPEIGQNKLFWPAALSYDGKNLWVGEFKFSGRILSFVNPTIGIEDWETSDKFVLFAPFPNPSTNTAKLAYILPYSREPLLVSLEIYDIVGRCIRIIVNTPQLSGYHLVSWDGRDENKKSLPSGIYFIKLRVGDVFSQTKKLLLLRLRP